MLNITTYFQQKVSWQFCNYKIVTCNLQYVLNQSFQIWLYQGGVRIWDSVTITNLSLTFVVSTDFSAGTNVVPSNMSRVTTARDNAVQVVLTNKPKSNLDKMKAYKEYVCGAVSYDDVAADNPATPYSNP